MIFQLGVFREAEIIIDLRGVGITVVLADGPGTEATMKMTNDARSYYGPVMIGDQTRTYNLSPAVPGEKEDGVHIWGWSASYYWTPPNTGVSIRRGEFTLARTGKREFRIEFSTWQTQTIQYVPDNHTAKSLEESFQVTRTT